MEGSLSRDVITLIVSFYKKSKTSYILYLNIHNTFSPCPQELQECEVTFPIIADASGEIFSLLGLVREDAIDPAQGLVPQARC